MPHPTRNQYRLVICLALALVTLVLYWPVTRHGFINFDDGDYITENAHVKAGLTWSGLAWAFQTGHAANWHPLTWLSHMLDCQIYGLNPAGHHLTNVLLHIANTLLLFLFLNRWTGTLWRSAFVAALFAWHPLHVESVAWAAERKDVLSTFFWMLTLIAYARYARGVTGDRWRVAGPETGAVPAPSRLTPHAFFYYALSLLFFAGGLMSKPMVVTLPFVLLLLDFWPLNRWQRGSGKTAGPLLLEKLPFFALALAGSVITFLVQQSSGAVWSPNSLPLGFRIANASLTYLRYISKTFCPTHLALIYPYPHHWPLAAVTGAALILALWSGLFLWLARRQPWLAVGWFWFMGTLVPTIGLVQVGVQSMADRYMYIPGIGLFILIGWGANDLLGRRRQKIAALIGTLALVGCLAGTSIQLRYWENSFKLFLHTVDVTTDNYAAEDCLGEVLENAGQLDAAYPLYADAERIEPDYPLAQFKLAMVLLEKDRPDEAFIHLKAAADLMPRNPDLQYDLGVFLSQHGKPDEAIGRFNNALRIKPDLAEGHNGLGTVLLQQSKLDEASAQFSEALRLKPDYADAHRQLALTLCKQHRSAEAIPHYREALRLVPDSTDALDGLAWILATDPDPKLRSGVEAVRLAEQACELTHHTRPALLTTLSAACAEAGQFSEAIATAQKAHDLAVAGGQKMIAAQDEKLLKLYQSNQPFRETKG